jgi:hypothetical protein
MSNIFLKTENGPLFEVDWLMDNGSKNLCVIKWTRQTRSRWLSWNLLIMVLIGLLGLVNGRSLQDSSLNCIWFEIDVKVPLLDFLGICNHSIKLFDTSNSLWWLLEQALSDVSHDALIFSNFGWNTDEGTELWWQIDVLPFLTNFKQRLIN